MNLLERGYEKLCFRRIPADSIKFNDAKFHEVTSPGTDWSVVDVVQIPGGDFIVIWGSTGE